MKYKAHDFDVILGDDLDSDEVHALVRDALRLANAQLADSAASYVWCTWRTYPEFLSAVLDAGLQPSGCIVWKKGRIGPGNSDYRPEHEFCLYCRPDEDNEHELCVYCKGESFTAGRGESDVWEVSRDTGYVHPTQKPVALCERALEHNTRRGDRVLDVFGGSGSTLIACENLDRRSLTMELDPAYCDVIIDRWERHAGKKAEKLDG